jgi:hypothetical protein
MVLNETAIIFPLFPHKSILFVRKKPKAIYAYISDYNNQLRALCLCEKHSPLFLLHRVPAVSIRHPQKAQNVPY